MSQQSSEVQLLAQALYQIRILLSDHLGSDNQGSMSVRFAAHLAYALHNEALAVVEGKGFDVEAALAKVEAIDQILKTGDGTWFSQQVRAGKA